MIKESQIVKEILDEIKHLGGKAIKIHGNQYMEIGTPDILGYLKGRMLAIECKILGESSTKIQEYRLQEWRKVGAIAEIVHSLSEFKDLIKGI